MQPFLVKWSIGDTVERISYMSTVFITFSLHILKLSMSFQFLLNLMSSYSLVITVQLRSLVCNRCDSDSTLQSGSCSDVQACAAAEGHVWVLGHTTAGACVDVGIPCSWGQCLHLIFAATLEHVDVHEQCCHTRSHTDLGGMNCHLWPWWYLGPCCNWGLSRSFSWSYCSQGLCWCLWSVLPLKDMWVSVAHAAAWSHVTVHG